MGYDRHITRRRKPTLSNENGQYCVRRSGPSELPDPWLDWHNAVICAKNPDHI